MPYILVFLRGLLNAWRNAGRALLRRYYPLHGAMARIVRRQNYIIDTFEGDDPCRGSSSAAVFCHYDRRGALHDYVEHYLKCLRDAGFRIYFVSNSPQLAPEAIRRLTPLCSKIMRRDNIGYDFGAYKEAILAIPDRRELARLLVVNDSIYGPFSPLESHLEAMGPDRADVWGLTDSFEIRYHLQSYFLLFHAHAIRHEAFERFWKELPFVSLKGWIIHHAEVALTQRLAAAGLRIKSKYAYEDITANFATRLRNTRALVREDIHPDHRAHMNALLNAIDAGIPLNPTHFFWEVLIGHMGYPFIKRDLLEMNPAHILGVSRWRELVRANSDYDLELIERHQKLRLRNRSL